SNGQLDLRAKVTEDLTDGSLGYRSMADSPHFFMPITEESDSNAAQRALASSQTETQQSVTKNMALRVVTDLASTDLSEATEYVDTQHDRAYYVVSHTVLPYRLMGTGSVGGPMPMAYGEPQRGMGQSDQLEKVNAQLMPLLRNDDGTPTKEGRAYLKKLFGLYGPEKFRADPTQEGYPRYQEHPNGTITHGVLALDDALDQLERTIEANKWPLDKGQTFHWGTIIPMVSGDGSIHLSRVGFKQPRHDQVEKQWAQKYQDKGRRISVALNTLDKNQSSPPPTRVDEVRGDARGLSVLGTYQPNPLAKGVD